MILTLHQVDPEFRLVQVANTLLGQVGLDQRGVGSGGQLVIEGHPLFEYGARSEGDDSYFPKIGVEWQSDEEEKQDINWNRVSPAKLDGKLREKLHYYLNRDAVHQVQPAGGSDRFYEQVSAKNYKDFLSRCEYCKFVRSHENNLLYVTGWATGNAGRVSSKFLYRAFKGLLPFLSEIMRERFRVSVAMVGSANLNLVNDQFGPARGWDLMLRVTQITQTFQLLGPADYEPPRFPFIFAEQGGTNMDTFFNNEAQAAQG